MAKNIRLELSSVNEDVYFDSFFIVNQLLKEKNVYPSSQKRVMMAEYLFALKINDDQIGFVSAVKDDKYYSDILSLDLCLLKPYRNIGIANEILPKVVSAIEHEDFDNKFIIIEKNRSHDDQIDGIQYSDDIVLLQDRLDEINYVHPDGIVKPHRVVSTKEAFYGFSDNKGRQ